MKKKMYRIELSKIGGIQNDIATLAALSNGGKYISLKDMESIAKVELLKYPTINENISINLIGEHNLTIDRGTTNLLSLEEVEVVELINEDCPTLNRHAGTGIDNPANFENIN